MGRLKSFLFVLGSVAVISLSACAFSACGKGYTPEAGTHYFEINGAYRVIDETPAAHEHIDGYALHSYIFPVIGATVANVKVTATEYFNEGSMFFSDVTAINKQGVIAVYEILGITGYDLIDDCFKCLATGLYSYNVKISGYTEYVIPDVGEHLGRIGAGMIADVEKYTFNYTDLSFKDGSKIGEGTFSIIICEAPYMDIFDL